MTASDLHETTIQAFIAQLQPREWNRPCGGDDRINERWNLARYFQWPPDIFVLTSLLLDNTGAYRGAITAPRGAESWPPAGWEDSCRKKAQDWCRHIANQMDLSPHPQSPGSVPQCLQEHHDFLQASSGDKLNILYDIEHYDVTGDPTERRGWDLCCHILALHAIADEAMRGVGTLYAPHVPRNKSHGHSAFSGIERLHLFANLLLTLRGSLSRIGKHRGIVLPKTLTPQHGLTIRSLSHYLTFHQTEVDVAWRAVPWPNLDEHTLNALIYAWPFNIRGTDFSAVHESPTPQGVDDARYFAYTPTQPFDPADIVRLVLGGQREVRRIHAVILPEAAINKRDLRRLKDALEDNLHPCDIPMLIVGVTDVDSDAMRFNRVMLSMYYCGKWYDMTQNKHHRWKLTPSQIATYQLTGALSGSRNAWEAIPIPRRRLSFLTSNAWLTVAPLICEDLARLDPVSSIIRGVGPTLLVALLLDGPQLIDRWPARYASVFAEDPGSSVLTVTAYGLTQRSLPSGTSGPDAKAKCEANKDVVALWKDQVRGPRMIRAHPESHAVILSVASQRIEEGSVDMRQDNTSEVFVLQVQRDAPPDPDPKVKVRSHATTDTPDCDGSATNLGRGVSAPRRHMHVDVLELSLFTFYLEALVDIAPHQAKPLHAWMRRAVGFDTDAEVYGTSSILATSASHELLVHLRWCFQNRRSVPRVIPTPQLLLALDLATQLVIEANGRSPVDVADTAQWEKHVGHVARLQVLFSVASEEHNRQCSAALANAPSDVIALERWRDTYICAANAAHPDRKGVPSCKERPWVADDFALWEVSRVRCSVPHAILAAVHNRITILRQSRGLRPEAARLMAKVEGVFSSSGWTHLKTWREQLRGTDDPPSGIGALIS